MTEKKNITDDSFKNLSAGGDINVNIGDRKSKWSWKMALFGVIVTGVIIVLIFQLQPPRDIKSNINETHEKESPVVIDSGGTVNINYQNTDPFPEDSTKNNKSSK